MRMIRLFLCVMIGLVVVAPEASARCRRARRAVTMRYSCPQARIQPRVLPSSQAPAPVTVATPAASFAVVADSSGGFVAWLNATRRAYGLGAVGHDANLEAWASQNNSHQHAKGMGHYVMGPARRQNSAMGSYATIGGMWMASPPHRDALLDPSITAIGLAGSGSYWTFNAR